MQDGRSPLYWASLKGHVAIVRLLIRKRADINPCDKVHIIVNLYYRISLLVQKLVCTVFAAKRELSQSSEFGVDFRSYYI